MTRDDDNFLSRWSRRKVEARKAAAPPSDSPPVPGRPAAAAPALPDRVAEAGAKPPPPDAGVVAVPVPPSLPPLDALRGVESEYREFLRPGVDEGLRRQALKKLFDDPHFNVMDGLDVYIDDYSKPDPIPEAMLKELVRAQDLLCGRDEPPAEAAPGTPPMNLADPAAPAQPGGVEAAPETPEAPGNARQATASETVATSPHRKPD